MENRKQFVDIWKLFSIIILILYLVFMLYPLLKILVESIQNPENKSFSLMWFKQFFNDYYYFGTLFNSFKLAATVTIVTLIIGVPLAYIFNIYEIHGRNFMQIMIILCSMSAPFLGAYSWILLLGRGGIITKFFKDVFSMQLPSIYGFGGLILVLSTKLFPLVFLYVSGALKTIDNSLLEASANLGCKGIERFFKVVVPLCLPSILAAALMVFMRALADFGTPLLIGEGYRTFPVEIYKQYLGETSTNHNFAAAISVIAILVTAIVFLVQKVLSDKMSFALSALHPIERKKPKKGIAILCHLYAYGLIAISYLPNLYLIYLSFRKTSKTGNMFKKGFSLDSYRQIFGANNDMVFNTLRISGTALIIILCMAVVIAYLVVRRMSILNNLIDTLSMIPYIIPGSVIGIALVMGFSKGPLVLTGTAVIMVVSMVIRRIPYTIRSSVATLQQIPISIEEAAISLGSGKLNTFLKITIPMMFNGILAGAIMSWVSLITELSSSIILYSSKTITLNLGVYIAVSRGTDGKACAISFILTILTIISLLIVMRLTKDKEVVM
jgi:hypothetical protein